MLSMHEYALNAGVERLRAEDFGSEVHRIIFRALVELWFEKKVADVLLLKEHLIRKNLLEKVGGLDYLYSIVQSSLSPRLIEEHCSRRASTVSWWNWQVKSRAKPRRGRWMPTPYWISPKSAL